MNDKLKAAYNKAKAAKTGSKINCPTCGKGHNKTSYQKVFCSNKGFRNCKDRFWNTVERQRHAGYETASTVDHEEDLSWDAHKRY